MNFDFLLMWPNIPICWINCNQVDTLPDNMLRKEFNAILAFDLFLKTSETALELLGAHKF